MSAPGESTAMPMATNTAMTAHKPRIPQAKASHRDRLAAVVVAFVLAGAIVGTGSPNALVERFSA
jgi:hypothetical protein